MGEAREQLRNGTFELALCDVNAAGELALALVEEIVTDNPETAVVLVTGEDDPRVADRAFDLGVHGYLVEPLQPGQLLITVMNALRRRDLEISNTVHTRNLWEQFQTLIDMAPIPIYAKDSSHRYVVANAEAEEMAGFGRGELIGETDEAFMDPAAVSATTDRLCQSKRQSSRSRRGEIRSSTPRIVDLLLGHVDEAISIRA